MINPVINFNPSFTQTGQVGKPTNKDKAIAQNALTNPIQRPKLPQPTTMMALMYNNINFTGHREDLVRSFGHVPCPCCGTRMLTSQDLEKVKTSLGKTDSGRHLIKTLKPYEEFMHPAEKGVFNRFEKWQEERPQATLQNFLMDNKNASMEKCKTQQIETYAKINELANEISPELGQKLAQTTKNCSKMPMYNEENMKDVRKYIISDVRASEHVIEDKDKYNQLETLAKSLPTSKNSPDAFIVRYAGQSSNKVAIRLLKLSVGTIEHVKPQADGGRDKVENYLLECGECNHTRGDVSLHDWVEMHPEMKENTQKYMDEVIDKINNNQVSDELNNYPNAVKGALREQSKGSLTYDTSALKRKGEKGSAKKSENSKAQEDKEKDNKPIQQHPKVKIPKKPRRIDIPA